MFNNMWDVKEPKHYSKRVGREVPGVVAVLCVVNTGPMLITVTTITEMVILYKYVEIIIIIYIYMTLRMTAGWYQFHSFSSLIFFVKQSYYCSL